MNTADVRAALIDAAKKRRTVVVSHQREGVECVVVGRVFSVNLSHVVMNSHQSETAVPLAAIEQVILEAATKEQP